MKIDLIQDISLQKKKKKKKKREREKQREKLKRKKSCDKINENASKTLNLHSKCNKTWKLGSVWLEGWKNGIIKKILISFLFVWLGVEKWRDGKK